MYLYCQAVVLINVFFNIFSQSVFLIPFFTHLMILSDIYVVLLLSL